MANGNSGPNVPYPISAAEAGLKKELDAALAAGTITKKEYDKAIKNLAASAAGVTDPQAALAGNPPNVSKTVKGATGIDLLPAAGAAVGAVTDIPKFLGDLTSPNTWVRVGEVVVGLIVVGVALNHVLGGAPAKTAKKAAKFAA